MAIDFPLCETDSLMVSRRNVYSHIWDQCGLIQAVFQAAFAPEAKQSGGKGQHREQRGQFRVLGRTPEV
jgi:hypothetical protein